MDEKILTAAEDNSEAVADTQAGEAYVTPADLNDAAVIDSKTGLLRTKRKRVSLDSKRARAGYVFTLPFILGVILIYIPILLDSIWFSLGDLKQGYENGNAVSWIEWNNFKHYISAFTDSKGFVVSLVEGIQQLIFEVPAVIVFSLFIAVVLNQKMLGRAVFRAIFFVPVIIATGLMESINAQDAVTSSSGGGINDGTGSSAGAGIVSTLDIERLFATMEIGGELVTYVVELVNNVYNIINYSGVQMLIFLAGLQSISPAIYEACQIEGATGWETFWKITFPMISPMILVNAVYTVIDAFTRTENVTMKFIQGVYTNRPYYATAMYWIYFIVIILIIAAVAGIVSTFIFYQRKD
ncbi:MAG: sugar ABC transporter permease [Clostridia bacterium]|nr:sugar ABC transporter permease [Clostridia bacterium]